jgi:integrase
LPKPKPKEAVLFNKSEQSSLEKFLIAAESLFSVGVLISLFLGIRIGELCALKWKDVDLAAKEIHVRHTLQRIKNFDVNKKNKTELVLTEPKSDKSHRTVPLPDFLIPILAKWKVDGDYFVLSGTKKPVEPRTVQNRFKRLLNGAGLPSTNFHSLHHLFATNCLQCNCDVKTLSELLGHSSADTTLKRYVHTSDERKRECINMLKPAA